jgi:molybdopterin molybdotransferase
MANSALSFDHALSRVLAEAAPLPVETVAFAEAERRVLAETLIADRDDPPHPKSAMDGYALVAGHTQGASTERPLAFQYQDVIGAGPLPNNRLRTFPLARVSDDALPAVRIMTGALLPLGADAVVKLEDTHGDASNPDTPLHTFRIQRPLVAGENVIPPGARMAAGEVLLAAGEALGPQALGILATVHHPTVRVYRRPVVALLALGDELVDVGAPLELGHTPLTNLHVLTALVRRYGGIARSLGVAPDDPERIRTILATCLEPDTARNAPPCDMVLTLGGSHGGDFDFAHAVLEKLGAYLRFDRVLMNPGASTLFATRGSTLFFGLPGTPATSWSAFETLVRPALWKLAGRHKLESPRLMARLAAPLSISTGRVKFVPCRLDLGGREPTAHPIEGRHPHEAPASLRADGLIRCPEGVPAPAVGAWVPVDWIGD